MIYEAIKSAVEAVAALADKVYPAGVCVDEVSMPCAVYTFGKRAAERDLSGYVHHYTDVVDIDLISSSYDQLHHLYCEVEEKLHELEQEETGYGEYIFNIDVSSPEFDAADLPIGVMRRCLRATVQWCPLDV